MFTSQFSPPSFGLTCSWSSCLGIIRTSRSMHSSSAKTRPQKDVVSHQWKRWVKGPLFLVPEQGGSVPIKYNLWSLCVYAVLRCCQLGCFMLPATCYPNRRNLTNQPVLWNHIAFPEKLGHYVQVPFLQELVSVLPDWVPQVTHLGVSFWLLLLPLNTWSSTTSLSLIRPYCSLIFLLGVGFERVAIKFQSIAMSYLLKRS